MTRVERRILRFLDGQTRALQKGPIEASVGLRTGGALDSLTEAGLVVKQPGGMYAITEAGRREVSDENRTVQGTGRAS